MATSTKYTRAEARARIKGRYENMEGRLPFTLQRLDTNSEFKATFFKLKAKGYADWVVYMAIVNTILNYRSHAEGYGPEEMIKYQKTVLNGTEKETDLPVPAEEFTEKKMEFAIELGMMSSLKMFGYAFRKRRPNLPAIRKFMTERYGYFEEDCPHKKWFSFENKD